MFGNKYKRVVVPESEYTDFSDRLEIDKSEYATKETYIAATLVPIAGALGYKAFFSNPTPSTIPNPTPIPQIPEVSIPVSAPQIIEPVMTPISQISQTPITYGDPNMIPTGYVADASLAMLANILDPIVDIMVALSFPICSVIILAYCFVLMLGKDEKALGGMMKAALAYCLIQISPLLLEILRNLGKSVAMVPQ